MSLSSRLRDEQIITRNGYWQHPSDPHVHFNRTTGRFYDAPATEVDMSCARCKADHVSCPSESPTWLTAPDGTLYTLPHTATIERLRNGLYRLYHCGSGLSSLHNTLSDAQAAV